MAVLDEHIRNIERLCPTHNVKQLYAFDSALTEKFNTYSDIDFIVNFEPIEASLCVDNYYDLQDVLNRPVDLLEEQAIKNPYFQQTVNQQRQLIYGETSS